MTFSGGNNEETYQKKNELRGSKRPKKGQSKGLKVDQEVYVPGRDRFL